MGAVVVGISPDSAASHKKFIEKHHLSVMLLGDPDHSVLKSYEAWGQKKMYGKEYEGVIRGTVVIDPEGKIRHHWPKASAKGHAAQVLKDMKRFVD